MLTAITVLAVVGGALAFKASKFTSSLYCTSAAGSGKCTILTPNVSIAPVIAGQPSLGSSSCTTTNVVSGDCAERPTYQDN